MKHIADLRELISIRKFTAVFMAAVLVVTMCVPLTGFADSEKEQGATVPQADEQNEASIADETPSDAEESTPDEADGSSAQEPSSDQEEPAASQASDQAVADTPSESSAEGTLSPKSEDEWASVEDTFTVEAIQQYIPDPGFAQAVYDSISFAIQNDEYHIDKANICDPEGYSDLWPEPLTVEEILDEGTEGDDLVIAILENYIGSINAYKRGITDITGFRYLKNTTAIDFQSNLITDLSIFTGGVVAGSYNFAANPVNKWPKTFPNTIRAATHGIATSYAVTTAPLAYRFGDTVTPTLTYDVYYPDENGVLSTNSNWYSKFWSATTAYGSSVPALPQANGTSSITLPQFSLEGSAVIEIGLTGAKDIKDYDHWLDNTQNAINYISGMSPNETGGATGQGNSPSYKFGVVAQRYATLNITGEAEVNGGFTFTKTSSVSGNPVAGAEYTLYEDKDCTTVIGGPYTTNAQGKIEEGGFTPGTYYLKESKAAAGYTINTEPITITIADPGSKTSVAGGVASFERDVAEPNVEAVWGTKTATNGVWDKTTATTTTTAESLSADALLTNKGNVGYKVLSSLKAEFNGSEETYEGSDTIVVKMGGKEYGTYTSDDAALAAINDLVKAKKLTGDITVEYKGTYAEKAGHYTATATQTDTPLPVNLSFNATKTFDGTLSGVQGAFGNFVFTATGSGEDGATLTSPAYNDADGKVSFGELSFSKQGTYEFTFAETQGSDPDTQYTTATHKVKVMVAAIAGGLSAQVAVDGSVVGTYTGAETNTVDAIGAIVKKPAGVDAGAFENHLKKPLATLNASKAVDLGGLVADQFTFSLVPGDDCAEVTYLDATQTERPLPASGWTAITNKADGSIDFASVFSSLAFPREEGTYHFTLSENDPPLGSAYNKDNTAVAITVSVTKNAATGKFETSVSYNGAAAEPVFTNTLKRASLTASKIVAEGGSDTDAFTFTLTFDAGTSGLDLTNSGVTGITLGAGNTATITMVNGAAASSITANDSVSSITYTVMAGKRLELDGVPVGLGYTVHEATHSHYYDNTDKSGTVAADGSSVSVSNQLKTGDVYVSKAVAGVHSSADDSFEFSMKLAVASGYSWTNRTYNISKDGGVTWGAAVSVASDADSITFNLQDGWMARVNKLPIGTYTTVETADDTYTAAPLQHEVKLDTTNVDAGAKIDFTNTKKAPTPTAVSLAATKTVDGEKPQTVVTGFVNGAYTTVPFEGAFSFKLSQVGALPAGAATPSDTSQTVTNATDGAVTFSEVGNLTAEGDYAFQVVETSTDTAYIDADGATYKAVVHVAYNAKADSGNKDYAGKTVTTPNSLYVDKITWTKDGVAAESAAFDNKSIVPTPVKADFDISKTLDGKTPDAGAFSFTLKAADGAPMPANDTVSNLADGSVSFGDIEFDKPGRYVYTITENDPTGDTILKDPRTYTVTVTVTDDGTNVLSTAVTYAASADTDITGAASATDEAAFVNATKTTVTIPVSKKITYGGGVTTSENMPTFMYELDGEDGCPMPEGDGNACSTEGAGQASFGAISFETAGTYRYTVTEIAPAPLATGWTYDRTSYGVEVEVSFDHGKMTVTPSYRKGGETVRAIEFTNDYTPVPTQATASPTVHKLVNGSVTTEPKLFDFTITPEDTNPSAGLMGMTQTVQASTAATADFGKATFDKAGTYVFTITEDDLAEGALPGYTTDGSTYTWTVAITDNGGQLKVASTTLTKDGAAAEDVTFTNTYAITPTHAQASPDIEKTLAGAWADAGTIPSFDFALTADGSNPVDGCTGLNADATISAADLARGQASISKAFGFATFSKAGTYNFTITEKAGVAAGWNYDTATYTWTVEVKDKDGKLQVSSSALSLDGKAASTAAFTNKYAPAPGVYQPKVNKAITGGTPAVADTFSFTLVGKDGAPMPASATATVKGAGVASFDKITYEAAGSYTYQISEVAGTNSRYTYDPTVYDVIVTVVDNNGVLEVSANASKAGVATPENAMVFTNDYNDELGKAEVKKTAKSTTANAGDKLSWDIVVTNPEAFDIYGVWVKDVAPEFTTLTAAAGDHAGTIAKNGTTQYASWFIPVLAAGKSLTLKLEATVNDDVPDGTVISNIAHFEVTGSTTEPDDPSAMPGEPTNKAETSAVNSKVPATTDTPTTTETVGEITDTGDPLPVVPLTATLLAGGALALILRRRVSER